jgi:hypothetical protein
VRTVFLFSADVLKTHEADFYHDSLPFSVHLLYALVEYIRFVAEDGGDNAKDLGSEAEVALLNEDSDGYDNSAGILSEERAEISLDDELRWPPRGKLVANWILQLFSPPILWYIRLLAHNAYHNPGVLYVNFHTSSLSPNDILANMLS